MATTACKSCHFNKIGCDEGKPSCKACIEAKQPCSYDKVLVNGRMIYVEDIPPPTSYPTFDPIYLVHRNLPTSFSQGKWHPFNPHNPSFPTIHWTSINAAPTNRPRLPPRNTANYPRTAENVRVEPSVIIEDQLRALPRGFELARCVNGGPPLDLPPLPRDWADGIKSKL